MTDAAFALILGGAVIGFVFGYAVATWRWTR